MQFPGFFSVTAAIKAFVTTFNGWSVVRMLIVGCKFTLQGIVGLTSNRLQAFPPLRVRLLVRIVLLLQEVLPVLQQAEFVTLRSCLRSQAAEVRV
jgi:hypothetical protein